MKIRFRKAKLSGANKARLAEVNVIVEEYQQQGLTLTLRQLYYQLVSRDIIPNKQAEYSKLSTILKEGRMSGVVDWDAIEDRLRKPSSPAHFNNPKEIIEAAHSQYRRDRMNGQANYIEVWVEKDALSGVLKRVTNVYGIPILVNRGYSSASAMFDSYQRFKDAIIGERSVTILYLGDYDPSGMDMIRDIRDRICEFLIKHYLDDVELTKRKKETIEKRNMYLSQWLNEKFSIVPIALTLDQIEEYDPPENPAKLTDPRAKKFTERHGFSSWEVDALRPEVLNQILTDEILDRLDIDIYNEVLKSEKQDKKVIKRIIDTTEW